MKKLDETTKEPHFYSSKIYFPCEKDARAGVFFVCTKPDQNEGGDA